MGKLTNDTLGYKMQVMPLADVSVGVVEVGGGSGRKTLVEMAAGSSMTVELSDGSTVTKDATGMVQYGIPSNVVRITVDTGPITIV